MKQLLTILEELHPDVDFRKETRLAQDGILDSFDIVTLVSEIEDAYGVLIPPEKLLPENFDSIQSIFALIRELR